MKVKEKTFFGDEKLLSESWVSKEDEEAFEYLQEKYY